jgi:hypothetical protein
MTSQHHDLSRSDKLLLFLFEKGKGKSIKVRYEDIVVGVFKKHPHDFHLKDYPEYPDSGDLIHKPLYDAKKKGYLNAANKVFALTESGLDYARQIASHGAVDETASKDRLSRSTGVEFARIKGLEGYQLFANGEKNKLTSNDFYDYLGVTVRTQKNAVVGRMNTLKTICEELRQHNDNPLAIKVVAYHEHLMSTNTEAINFFTT